MVEREYIKIIFQYFFCICISLFINFNTLAEAWVVKQGKYKSILTFATIDENTRDIKKSRSAALINVRDELNKLRSLESSLIILSATRNSAKIKLEKVRDKIEELEQVSNLLFLLRDEHFAQFTLEYGASKSQSFGFKLDYVVDKFAKYHGSTKNKLDIGKKINIFYKYQLFSERNFVASIKPMIEFSSDNQYRNYNYLDLALYLGYSKEKRNEHNKYNNINFFYEIGYGIKKHHDCINTAKLGYYISFLDGFKINNGLSMTYYSKYEKSTYKNILFSHTLYEQISLAKEFFLGKKETHILTAQFGYFWKKSLNDESVAASGPIISLWFDT